MSWKNTALKGLTSLFASAKNEVKDPEKPRILVVSTTGLGDSLWGTPAIRAIKTRFPNSHLGLLTSPIGKALYQNNPYIDETFTLESPALFSCIRLLPTLKKNQFEQILIFHLSQRPVLPLVSLCNPTALIGTAGINKGLDSLLTEAIENRPIHEIERRLKLAEVIGAPQYGGQMELFLTSEEKEAAQDFLRNTSFPIGIHPGAKDRFKQWKPSHFISLGQRLQKEYGAKIFVTGSQDEIPLAKTVSDAIPHATSVAGKFSIRMTAALIEKFKLFLANDTGPMHIAYATQTPTFSLFGPTHFSLCGPHEIPHAAWVQKPPTCSPCLKKKCQVPFCLEQVSENAAWKCINKLLL